MQPRQETNEAAFASNIQLYTDLIADNPNDSMAYINRGLNHFNLGHNEDAISDFTHAIELKSIPLAALLIPYHKRGIAFTHLMKFDEAIEDFSTCIQINDKNPAP
ncbi:MAG: tetratricopeptide repeat protein, partial [Gammaproteobacteria bacterium]